MQTNTDVKFTRNPTDGSGGSGGLRSMSLHHVPEDNVTALEAYEKSYQEANNKYPDYTESAQRDKYIALLSESLTDSYTQLVRLYNYGSGLTVNGVRHGGLVRGGSKTGSDSEVITVLGSDTVSTRYPITAIGSMTMSLKDKDGVPVTERPTINENKSLSFKTEVFGFITIDYTHTYLELKVTTTTKKGMDKLSSVVMCYDNEGSTAMEVHYPDVEDKLVGVVPEGDTEWKVTIRKGLGGMGDVTKDEDDDKILRGNVYTEYARTVSPIVIEGIEIDRAETVSFRSEDEAELKLVFTSLTGGQ